MNIDSTSAVDFTGNFTVTSNSNDGARVLSTSGQVINNTLVATSTLVVIILENLGLVF